MAMNGVDQGYKMVNVSRKYKNLRSFLRYHHEGKTHLSF